MTIAPDRFVLPEDVGRGWLITQERRIWRDYAPPQFEGARGESLRLQSTHPTGERFEILAIMNQVFHYRLGASDVSYEVLLVRFDGDRARIDAGTFDGPVTLDDDYLGRAESAVAEPTLRDSLAPLRGRTFPDLGALDTELRGDPDLLPFAEELLHAVASGYLWRIYEDAVYAEPEIPDLARTATGLAVLTAQLWLAMLGDRYAPSTRGTRFDDAGGIVDAVQRFQRDRGVVEPPGVLLGRRTFYRIEEALQARLPNGWVEDRPPFPRATDFASNDEYIAGLAAGLRSFGIPVEQTGIAITLPLTISGGVGTVDAVPPGDYALRLEQAAASPATTPPRARVVVECVDDAGDPVDVQIALCGESSFSAASDRAGRAVFDNIPARSYVLGCTSPWHAPDRAEIEVRLEDAQGRPLDGRVRLDSELADPSSLAPGIRLFKMLAHGASRPRDGRGNIAFPRLLTYEFDDPGFFERVWDRSTIAWGAFFGAPWLGIVFDPGDGIDPSACNWTTEATSDLLYRWGEAYLAQATDPADRAWRLQRPIVVRRLSGPRGELFVDDGVTCALGAAILDLPRRTERTIAGRGTGQFYGGIGPDDPDLDDHCYALQSDALASLDEAATIALPPRRPASQP
ncbi:MAG TPA: hypothetical protein VGD80_19835 [Kofleriaceae bacterium]